MTGIPAAQGTPVRYAEFTALPGRADEVAALLDKFTEQVRREPGNVLFIAHRLSADPDKFFVYEEYRDQAAFADHITAEYGARFNKALNPLIVEDGSQLTWLTLI